MAMRDRTQKQRNVYQQACAVLSLASHQADHLPLLARDQHLFQLETFLIQACAATESQQNVSKGAYISGQPGTGKTALVSRILRPALKRGKEPIASSSIAAAPSASSSGTPQANQLETLLSDSVYVTLNCAALDTSLSSSIWEQLLHHTLAARNGTLEEPVDESQVRTPSRKRVRGHSSTPMRKVSTPSRKVSDSRADFEQLCYSTDRARIILVLDEIDQLQSARNTRSTASPFASPRASPMPSRAQTPSGRSSTPTKRSVEPEARPDLPIITELYQLALDPSSRLVLIGIANDLTLTASTASNAFLSPTKRARPSLDLDDRIVRFNFEPYTSDDMTTIAKQRLSLLRSENEPVSLLPLFMPPALSLAAKKCAKIKGDLRQFLGLLAQIVRTLETEQLKALGIFEEGDSNSLPTPFTTPTKRRHRLLQLDMNIHEGEPASPSKSDASCATDPLEHLTAASAPKANPGHVTAAFAISQCDFVVSRPGGSAEISTSKTRAMADLNLPQTLALVCLALLVETTEEVRSPTKKLPKKANSTASKGWQTVTYDAAIAFFAKRLSDSQRFLAVGSSETADYPEHLTALESTGLVSRVGPSNDLVKLEDPANLIIESFMQALDGLVASQAQKREHAQVIIRRERELEARRLQSLENNTMVREDSIAPMQGFSGHGLDDHDEDHWLGKRQRR